MKAVLRALAALSLILPAAMAPHAAEAASADTATEKGAQAKPPQKQPTKPGGKRASPKSARVPSAAARREAAPVQTADTLRVARWVANSNDNHALPFAIIDKQDASLSLYDATGKLLDKVPVLIGIARGDTASAGVGSKKLSEIGPAEKTTPAGRFLAKFGLAFGRERVLWVDYATSVAIHTIPADSPRKERRRERMLSDTPADNRVTFGCINVPKAFYARLLRPQFAKKGGYVYVLPDSQPIEAVFPRLRVEALREASGTGGPPAAMPDA